MTNQEWFDNLSKEEQEKVRNATHNPLQTREEVLSLVTDKLKAMCEIGFELGYKTKEKEYDDGER